MIAPALHADDGDGPSQQARAARLSSVDGQVELIQNGQGVADHALVNSPLFEGAQISTADDGRAEVQFEDGSVARIPPDSSITISALRPGGDTEVTLNSGLGYFEVHGGGQGAPMRIRFGSNVVTCSSFSVLRVKMDEAPGELAVFSGNAHLEGGNGVQVDLNGGDSVPLNTYAVAQLIEPDSWDAWNSDRDQAITTSEEGPGAPAGGLPDGNNPAWSDLNDNGTWYNVPDQGNVWSPYEASNPDWDPYGTGNWMYEPAYGYVWVSGEPWGYMPYQCGAWNWYNSFGWGWAPGACSPWWGGSVWVINVGYAPHWYRRPIRPIAPPHPHPVRPRQLSDRQMAGNVHPVGPAPVMPIISVNRRLEDGGSSLPPVGTVLPPRDRTRAVMIGNTIASPVVTQAPREGYNRLPASTVRPVAPVPRIDAGRPGYVRTPEMPAGRVPSMPVTRPGGGSMYPSSGSRPTYAPPPSAPRSAPPPAYHPPAGGGGGRPSAPAGGGGGGHPAAGPHSK